MVSSEAEKNSPSYNVLSNIQIYTLNHSNYRRIIKHTYFIKAVQMSDKRTASLHTLPINLVFEILDNVDEKTLFISCYGVCRRLNDIIHTYKPYQVIIDFLMNENIFINIRYIIFFRKALILANFTKDTFEITRFIQQIFILNHILYRRENNMLKHRYILVMNLIILL